MNKSNNNNNKKKKRRLIQFTLNNYRTLKRSSTQLNTLLNKHHRLSKADLEQVERGNKIG